MNPHPIPRHRLERARARLVTYAYELTEPRDGDEIGIDPGRPAILDDQEHQDLLDIIEDYRRRHHLRRVDTITSRRT